MNRMGMSHETHDVKQTDYEESKQQKPPKQSGDEFHGSAYDALHELGKQVNKAPIPIIPHTGFYGMHCMN